MRDLTKSMLRFSWALPLFGIQQLADLSVPTRSNQVGASRAMDGVSATAQSTLGSALQGLYDSGDRLQRGMVDAVFDAFMLDVFDPGRWLQGSERPRTRPSLPAPPAAVPAPPASSAQTAPVERLGWGPMPG